MSTGVSTFYTQHNPADNSICLITPEKLSDWNPVLRFFMENLKSGILNWTVDLRSVGFVNSIGLGALIKMNTSCRVLKGGFSVIVQPNSQAGRVIKLSRLQLIMDVIEKELEESEQDESMAAVLELG